MLASRSTCATLVWVSLASSTIACLGPGQNPEPNGRVLSAFAADVLSTGRVLENSTACVVDAVCHLRIEFADTSIVAVYGSGERPASACETPPDVSNVAFEAEAGDLVEVVISTCASGGHYVRQLTRPLG